MAPLEGPLKELDQKYGESIVKFVSEIRSGKLEGSNKIAFATVNLLEQIINDSKNATAFELVGVVREVGRRLSRALPHELVCGNMARRVLRAIRDEHRLHSHQGGAGGAGGAGGGESLQRLVRAAPARRAPPPGAQPDLRGPLRDHLAELRLELESSISAIGSMSCEHVHADELILSAGAGELLQRFLSACSARRYRLLLADTARTPRQTHSVAARLSGAGVAVTVVSNASVGALMSRVNKVVVEARAALAGGALLADAGVLGVTLAARHYSVPVIALAPLYKLSPLFACDPRHSNALSAPHHALSYENSTAETRVFAPLYDYIPPDHVTLFITNNGGSSPSYVYRLLSELYDPSDYQI